MGAHIDNFTVSPTSTDIYKPISIHVEAHVDLLEGELCIISVFIQKSLSLLIT